MKGSLLVKVKFFLVLLIGKNDTAFAPDKALCAIRFAWYAQLGSRHASSESGTVVTKNFLQKVVFFGILYSYLTECLSV